MAKIETYDNANPVKLTDKVIGTSVGGSPVNETRNFEIQDLLALFQSNIDLESVLSAGNTATNNIILTGEISCSGNLTSGGTVTCQDFSSLGNATVTNQMNCDTLFAAGTITCQQVDASGRIDAQRVVVVQNVEAPTVNATIIAPISAGVISIVNLPTYADNASAVGAGLAVDRVYKTATGEIRIVV